jgi:nicotinate phosphoribosyltransferase
VYYLLEFSGTPRRKRSPGKATWPGRKQVLRESGADGRFVRDVLVPADEAGGAGLLVPVMRGGRRVSGPESLETMRGRAAAQLAGLPEALRKLAPAAAPYEVEVSASLRRLAESADAAVRPAGSERSRR